MGEDLTSSIDVRIGLWLSAPDPRRNDPILRPKFRLPGHAGRWRRARIAARRQRLEAAAERAGADLVVLNTCTVTSAADDDVRQTIRRVHRENPAARILVTGCYAQRAPEELAALPGVEWVVGNSHKTQIAELVDSAARRLPYHGNIHVGDIFAQHDFLSAPVEDAAGDRTRPNLKIQDGCNNRCSFCIIPFVRGRSRSAPAGQVVEQVRGLARRYREIVLSGINLGRWGREPGSTHAAGRSAAPSAGGNRSRAPAPQLRRADGFLRRPAGPDGRIAAHRQTRPRAAAIRLATASCAACTASTARAIMPTAC